MYYKNIVCFRRGQQQMLSILNSGFGRLAVAQRFAVQTAAIECKAVSSLDQIWQCLYCRV